MLRLETEEEIRQMLYGIIVDGEIWEYKGKIICGKKLFFQRG